MKLNPLLKLILVASQIVAFVSLTLSARADETAQQPAGQVRDSASQEKFESYVPRFGRVRPVIAVLGQNDGTVLTDFVIPYSILKRSQVAEVATVATAPRVLTLMPALKIQPDLTTAGFDERYPDGADFVIVPAVLKQDDPTLLAWIIKQSSLGATVVSICDGALVVARTGLLDGHRATAHWATEGHRKEKFPQVQWVKNVRYVSDGKFGSSSGITAAIPTSIALVEAIAGREKANALASDIGVSDWSSEHNSDAFQPRFGVNLMALITTNFTNSWFYHADRVGIAVDGEVDEMAVALAAEAYSRTGRAKVFALSMSRDPVRLKYGLSVVPDCLVTEPKMVKSLSGLHTQQAARVLDESLDDIARRYGNTAAYGVALTLEYPTTSY